MAREFGRIDLSYNSKRIQARGSFKVNRGEDVKTEIVGSDGFHGFKSMPQAPSIEGEMTVGIGFDVEEFLRADDMAVLLTMGARRFALKGAANTTEGVMDTEEGSMPIKLVGRSMEVFSS